MGTESKAIEEEKGMTDQIDVTEDSISSIIANSKSISHDTEVEDGKTVELEGNMISLLEVAVGKNSDEEESETIDQINMTADSVSLVVNDVAIKGMNPKKSAQLDHPEEFDHKTTRLMSLSSSSFTLNQVDEEQISI